MATETGEKTVLCLHSETIEAHVEGDIGTCKLCGQVRQYDPNPKRAPKVIKRGRINGILTEITPPKSLSEPLGETHQEQPPAPVSEPEKSPPEVPPRPKKRRQLQQYFEQNKEAILTDYYSMRLMDFFVKWHLTSTTWIKLKKLWNAAPKLRVVAKRTSKPSKAKPEKETALKPPDWDNLTRQQKFLWYENNKTQILADIIAIGLKKTRRKWNIPSGTFTALKKRWFGPQSTQDYIAEKKLHPANELPQFPAFSDSWMPTVQIKWLEVYERLYKNE